MMMMIDTMAEMMMEETMMEEEMMEMMMEEREMMMMMMSFIEQLPGTLTSTLHVLTSLSSFQPHEIATIIFHL